MNEISGSAEKRLQALGLTLPEVTQPKYTYLPFKGAGNIIFLSGQVPRLPDGSYLTGKVGADCTVEDGREAARLCGLHMLAAARSVTGTLDDIEFIKLLGMVNAKDDFRDHPTVVNACSELLIEVLGSKGSHARSAVGMGSLPANIRVEIEAIIRVMR